MKYFNYLQAVKWRQDMGRILTTWLLLMALLLSHDVSADENNLVQDTQNNIQTRSASYNLSTNPNSIGNSASNPASLMGESLKARLLELRKSNDGIYRVGIILPLSGEFSKLGNDFLNAITLALFDNNDASMSLIVSDDKGTIEGAKIAAIDVLARDADVILGPIFDYTIAAASPISRSINIPLIGFSNNRHIANDGIYLLNFSPEQQVDRVMEYAANKNISRFAALIPEGYYGTVIEESFRTAVESYDGELVDIVYYNAEFDSLETAAELLSQTDIGDVGDAILIPEGGDLLVSLVSFLALHNIDTDKVRLLGTGLWDDPQLCREPSLNRGWFSSPSRILEKPFQTHFQGLYGHPPPRIVELGYDALFIAAMLQQQGLYADNTSVELLNDGGFTGINGLFRFLPNGLSERGLSIFEIRADKIAEISPAYATFQ